MFDFIKNALGVTDGPRESSGPRSTDDIRIATCALFLELASIDNEFSDEERQAILDLMQSEYDLSPQHAKDLAEAAVDELKGSIDVWQFTNLINDNYNDAEKMRVVELLWRLVYVDGKLDAHEDYLMHKIGRLLKFPHKDLMAAKLKVLHEDN